MVAHRLWAGPFLSERVTSLSRPKPTRRVPSIPVPHGPAVLSFQALPLAQGCKRLSCWDGRAVALITRQHRQLNSKALVPLKPPLQGKQMPVRHHFIKNLLVLMWGNLSLPRSQVRASAIVQVCRKRKKRPRRFLPAGAGAASAALGSVGRLCVRLAPLHAGAVLRAGSSLRDRHNNTFHQG